MNLLRTLLPRILPQRHIVQLARWKQAWDQGDPVPVPGSAVQYEKGHYMPSEEVLAACVDEFSLTDAHSVFVAGWIWDVLGQLRKLELLSGDGVAVPIHNSLARFPRIDVSRHFSDTFGDRGSEKTGFLCHTSVPSGNWHTNVKLRVWQENGGYVDFSIPSKADDPFCKRRRVLESIPSEPYYDALMMADQIKPALSRLQAACQRRNVAARTIVVGEPPSNPTVSIIVPLYHQLHFVEHQLAHFVQDSFLKDCEIIYVLDSPEQETQFAFDAFHWHRLYCVPFRIVVMERNSGYSAANNAGMSAARAGHLLFLNSDVFPKRAGWVSEMLEFYQQTPGIGILGPKLLYDDDTLQHAGMYFYNQFLPSRLWINLHYFKGLPGSVAPANVARAVPAVTGACMLVNRDRLEAVGGWDESYIIANYEDSDLCLRMRRNGSENWYLPSVELYHLEGQSQAELHQALWKRNCDYYNRWLQTDRWDGLIEETMRRYPASIA